MPERPADFEEGEFRGPLFNQLLLGSNLLWEPGQVFEEHVGIDYAAQVENEVFWRLHHRRYRAGVSLAGVGLDYIWKKRKQGKLLPPFALNVFVQAKRSNTKDPIAKAAKTKGLASPCWFFNINNEQQKALVRLSSAISGKGLVCYAAPAFNTQAELYLHTEKRSVVQNTTFPAAGKLHNHSRWYYDRSGTFGVANPRFERVEIGRFATQIERLAEAHRDLAESAASENLALLVQAIDQTLENPAEISARDVWLSFLTQLLIAEAEEFLGEVPEIMRSYLRVRAYCNAHGLEWLTLQ